MGDDRGDLLAALAGIGRSLQDVFDPRRFLTDFAAHIERLLPHDRLMIAYCEEGGALSVFAEHPGGGPLLHEGRYTIDFDPGGFYSADEWVVESVLRGEAMVVRDFREDPRFRRSGAEPPKVVRLGLRSRVAVPLASGGRIVGILFVGSATPNAYTETHVAMARQVAELISPFIENIVVLHREQRRRRRLATLVGLACIFGSSLNFAESFEQVANAVRPILDFDAMGVGLLGVNGRDLELVGKVADSPEPPSLAGIPLDDLSFSAKVRAGEAVLIRDAHAELDPARPGDRRLIERGNGSCLSVPLWFCENVGGVLFFSKRRPNWYDSADVEVASGIAGQVVVALQHQRLAEEQAERARIEGRARELEQRLTTLRQELGDRYGFERILGRAPALQEALTRAAKVAPTETTVLLTGESGTGKELVARAVHHASQRAEGPFVAINCAALPETLVDSELFGHERGAFTGADKQKPGRFEVAAGGTLFLDEVGELPPAVQAKLLRVVQEHEFQRVGGTATLRVDVRLVTATNQDLARAVEAGTFREDLYYRLNVFSVHLPPLRERGDDVLLLANHFVREFGVRFGKGDAGLSRDAEDALRAYQWPGNIRELANAVERSLILADGGLLTAAHFDLHGLPDPHRVGAGATPPTTSAPEALADLEKRAILAALDHTKGNKTQAAAILGITRTQLHTRLKRFGLTA